MILSADGSTPDGVVVAPARDTATIPSYRHRPSRRFTDVGPRGLGNDELLCVLLGTPRAHDKALRMVAGLWAEFGDADGGLLLRDIAAAEVPQIARAAGISRIAAAKLLAALELGRRAAEEERPDLRHVRGGRDIYEHMRPRFVDLRHEEFWVVLLNTQHEITRELAVSVGLLHTTMAHPREVFRAAIQEAAHSVVLVHNHPAGDPTPSPEDHSLTEVLVKAGETVGIAIADHVIIGEGRYYSFLDRGALPFSGPQHSYTTGPR